MVYFTHKYLNKVVKIDTLIKNVQIYIDFKVKQTQANYNTLVREGIAERLYRSVLHL